MNRIPHIGVAELGTEIATVTREMVALDAPNFQQFCARKFTNLNYVLKFVDFASHNRLDEPTKVPRCFVKADFLKPNSLVNRHACIDVVFLPQCN